MKKFKIADIGFVLLLLFFGAMLVSPKVKGFVLRQLIKTGLYEPNVDHLKPKSVSVSDKTTVKMAPAATFRNSTGQTVDIANSKGKVIFLNFWATWCPPCIAEMPSVNSLRSKFKNNPDVLFVMADIDNKMERSESFMKKNKYDLPVYEPTSSIPESIFQGTVPTTLIINKSGEIVFFHEGMADYNSDEMEKFLTDLAK
ncbi:MAG TPA: TlpA disulfide reductase family protein [Sphingobacteriaceae bacterium]